MNNVSPSMAEFRELESKTEEKSDGGLERITCTVREACKITGLGRTSIWALIRDGQIESAFVCGRRLIVIASLRKLLGVAK